MTTYNLFPSGTTLPTDPASDGAPVSLGTEFWADASGYTITKLRWYTPVNSTSLGARQGAIYQYTDEQTAQLDLVGSVETFPTATAGQWCEVTLSSPIAMTPFMRYIVAVYHPNGNYAATGGYFASGGEGATSLVQDGLHRPNRATAFGDFRQGQYHYGEGIAAPTDEFNGGSYFSDVEVSFTSSAVTLSPSGIASAEAFGTATATATLIASPGGIASAEALGAAAVSTVLTASPAAIASGEAFGTAAATATLTVSPSGIATGESLGSPAVSYILTASPSGIASGETFGTPAMSGTLTATADGIATEEAFGTPFTTGSPVVATAVGIGTLEVFGTPTANKRLTTFPSGIATAVALGTPAVSITPAAVHAIAVAIASLEVFGSPTASGALGRPPMGSSPGSRYSGAFLDHRWDGSLG